MQQKFTAIFLACICFSAAAPALAQNFEMPPEKERCPSRWGAEDQRGSANWITAQSILKATRLVKTGELFELGAALTSDPKESFINEGRQYNIYTKPSLAKPNTRTENEEIITTELGQIGTQIDALAHQMWNDSFYNCFKQADIATRTGFRKLGVENFGSLISRAVLIDVAAYKGVDMLPAGYVITPEDLQRSLERQNTKLEKGDAVLINTGFGKLLGKDNVKYGKDSPGIGLAAGRWLVTQDPMLIGADNCCVEVRPSEPGMSLPVHSLMLIQNGIILLENLLLDKMASAQAYETMFVVQPLKLKGATGSNVAPVAIR
jgi:kynurenine formamidase